MGEDRATCGHQSRPDLRAPKVYGENIVHAADYTTLKVAIWARKHLTAQVFDCYNQRYKRSTAHGRARRGGAGPSSV
jgi:hypothetical protein